MREERLIGLIEPAVEAMGFEIVRLRIIGAQRERQTIQIMADRPEGGITVDECAEISRTVSPILDVEDPFPGDYTLEVSSPGIARPLVRLKDFERYAGHVAKVELSEPLEGRRRFKGTIDGTDTIEAARGEAAKSDGPENDGAKESAVLLAVPGERGEDGSEVAFALPFALIADARLVMTDALLEEAAARQAEESQLTDGAGQIAPDPAPESVAGDQERGKDMAEGPVERVEKTHG
ncbi:MAG: ribosome maturation factor RimP [Pseudomonadota bacterium]